jgi:DUF1365 family protein
MAFELAITMLLLIHFQYNNEEQAGSGRPQLRLRKPQASSAATAKEFTKENVAKFVVIVKPMLQPINFSPLRLFNCGETGLTVTQHKVCKVFSYYGKRHVSSLPSAQTVHSWPLSPA